MDDDIRLNKRNLLIIIFIIFFYYYSGAEVKDINLLGVKADITNREALIRVGWVAFAYFFVKYIQYFISFGYEIVLSELNKTLNKHFAHSALGLSHHDFDSLNSTHFLKSTAVEFRFRFPWAGLKKYPLHKNSKIGYSKGINLIKYKYLKRYNTYQLIKSFFSVFCVEAKFRSDNSHELTRFYCGIGAYKILHRIIIFMLVSPTFTEHVVPLLSGVLLIFYVIYF